MYYKRIKIFVILSTCLLLVSVSRLVQIQILSHSHYREKIAQLKRRRADSRRLKTTRGKILDRKGNVLAVDEPKFLLHINYSLSRFADQRIQKAMLLKAGAKNDPNTELAQTHEQIEANLDQLQLIIQKSAHFDVNSEYVRNKITRINNKVWNLRTYLTRKRAGLTIEEFKKKFPDPNERIRRISKIDIAEMHRFRPLFELQTDDDIFVAQLEFMNIEGVKIISVPKRYYPYNSAAAQTIGWVGLATQKKDRDLFKDDRLSGYLENEVCGREDGVEYICETTLRGRRGEELYDIDRQLVNRTDTQPGQDVTLTIDIELQLKIINLIADCQINANCQKPTAAVVLDIQTAEILALVSTPAFDLNLIRQRYSDIANEPNNPLINKAINKNYPPGSTIKPFILIAALESGAVTDDEVTSCTAERAPKGWPSCWVIKHYRGHDDQWPNYARNALKGSCNVYFSRLADKMAPFVLQKWLYKFGLGRKIIQPPPAVQQSKSPRNFRQAAGIISSANPWTNNPSLDQIPPLQKAESRFFGIGQGNLRATVLQITNAFAAIARGGIYKPPRLFLTDNPAVGTNLNISQRTLDVVRDGTSAVVNEAEGTAYKAFAYAEFELQDVRIFGKTGSSQEPNNALFAGFAEDSIGRSIAITVLVEGGQSGQKDAAPIAREIIQACIDTKYLGKLITE